MTQIFSNCDPHIVLYQLMATVSNDPQTRVLRQKERSERASERVGEKKFKLKL